MMRAFMENAVVTQKTRHSAILEISLSNLFVRTCEDETEYYSIDELMQYFSDFEYICFDVFEYNDGTLRLVISM